MFHLTHEMQAQGLKIWDKKRKSRKGIRRSFKARRKYLEYFLPEVKILTKDPVDGVWRMK